MKDRKLIVERIKNILIVVLFLAAILLLSFFGGNFSIDDLKNINIDLISDEDDRYQPVVESFINPDNITVYFGSDMYTVLSSEYDIDPELALHNVQETELNNDSEEIFKNAQEEKSAEAFKQIVAEEENGSSSDDLDADEPAGNADAENQNKGGKSTLYESLITGMEIYLSSSDVRTERIEKIQYDEVMSYASISATFKYDIPFKEFLEKNRLTVPSDSEMVSCLTSIGFSTASSENLFIYDGSVDEYYRFVTESQEKSDYMTDALMSVINSIEQSGCMTYYSIENLAGVKNETLIPLYMESDLKSIKCEKEFSINNANAVRKIEQAFFSSGLDFVRKITQNKGSLLYMYGYSQKVLFINEDGSINYTEELDPAQYSETGFYDALLVTTEYVKNHGGWADLYKNGMSPCLTEVKRIAQQGKYTGYSFKFGLMLNGTQVEYSGGSMLSVEVYGSQVTRYDRDIIIISEENSDEIESWMAENAINVITDEYVNICSILEAYSQAKGDSEAQEAYSSEKKFEEMMKRVNSIKFCFMRDSSRHANEIMPVWYMAVDGCRFWFDPVSGAMLGYSLKDYEQAAGEVS
ncbi:MAG: hypothetical protein HFE90_04555 [Firmicutes bacterium]|nr:hypothetical protein [Bacillota bacterium]